ncbi:MAG: hypothetical protein ACM31D_06525 [Bacteroidota bacterium]
MEHSAGEVLDLRAGRLTADQDAVLVSVMDAARQAYTRMIAEVSASRSASPDWWATVTASRNTYRSTIFRLCTHIALVRALRAQGRLPSRIVTDQSDFVAPLRQVAGLARVVAVGCRSRRNDLRNFVSAAAEAVRVAWQRWRAGQKPRRFDQPVILLDVFAFDGDLTAKGVHDRYFAGIDDTMPPAWRDRLLRLPTWFGMRDVGAAIAAARACPRPVLFKEDFLRPSDYLYALTHVFRLVLARRPRAIFESVALGGVLFREQLADVFSLSTQEALLNYRLCRRLKERAVPVRLVVDWFEGQQLDKCLHLGLRHYLPEVDVVGYQGAAPRRAYHSYFVAAHELAAHVAPARLVVPGAAHPQLARLLAPELDAVPGPAFRFQPPATFARVPPDRRAIIVMLPVSIPDSSAVLEALAASRLPDCPVEIKAHPTHGAGERSVLAALVPAVAWTDQPVLECYARAAVVVTCGSNSALEALALGIPVVLAAFTAEMAEEIPLPDDLVFRHLQICRDRNGLGQAIAALARLEVDAAEIERCRRACFGPVTVGSTAVLLTGIP